VAELAARLNLKKAEAVGLCTLVWAAIAEHRPSGDITGVGISALEDWGCWVPRKGAGAGAFGKHSSISSPPRWRRPKLNRSKRLA
jgi:hypothetical protein